MKAVIIADGDGSRWDNHLGIPKHLAPVDGEPIIHRTARLFSEAGCEVVIVAPSDSRYETPYAELVEARHDRARWLEGDKFASSSHHWSQTDSTIVVYGDVYFTGAAVHTITTHPDPDWTLFGRFGPSKVTGGKHAEVFAIRFTPAHHAEFLAALEHASELARTGVTDRCGGWEVYRAMNGLQGRECRHRSPQPQLGKSVVIDDWTEDFDRPRDYQTFLARRTPDPITIAVPFRIEDDYRRKAWEYVSGRWAAEHPTWPLVTGEMNGEWRKARAVKNAVDKAETPLVMVVDADVWIPSVEQIVFETQSGGRWAKPHRMMIRLTPKATESVLSGADLDLALEPESQEEPPYPHVIGGGAVLLPTEVARECPGDERFIGWGGQDTSWGWMLQAILGRPLVGTTPAIHLWHPPQARPTRARGSAANEALKAKYSRVRNDRAAMLALIEEGRARA